MSVFFVLVFFASVFNDARYPEELTHAIGSVGERRGLRQAGGGLVVTHDVDERDGVGRRLHALHVDRLQLVDVFEDHRELVAHPGALALGERQASQPGNVLDVLVADHRSVRLLVAVQSISSRCAYCSDSRFRPTLAKRTVTIVSPPSFSMPT